MARIPDLRQIIQEDFDQKDRKLIDKLAFPINNFMQQVITVLKNGIDFSNLNQQIVTLTISVDADGKPTTDAQFQNKLSTKVIGILCISAVNKSGFVRYPEATPFFSFTENAGLVTITNVAGLGTPGGQTNSDSYTFTILTIGQNIPTN